MPFIAEGDERAGPWRALNELRLRQLTPNSHKTYFLFDQRFGYSPLVDPPSDGEYPHPGSDMMFDQRWDQFRPAWKPWRTDLASVPAILWGLFPSYGRHTASALMHDLQCEESNLLREHGDPGLARRLRRRADLLFRVTLADVAEMGLARRWSMWTAVRLFSSTAIGALTLVVALFVPLFAFTPGDWSCAWLPMSFQQIFGLVLAVAVVGLTACMLHASVEAAPDIGPAAEAMDARDQQYPGQGVNRFTWRALASIVGAVLLGIPLVYLIAPTVMMTGATRLALAVGDVFGEAACWVGRVFQPRKQFTVFSPPPGRWGESPPGPATGDDGEPGPAETAERDRLRHVGFVDPASRLDVPYAAPADVDSNWALGVLLRHEAPPEQIKDFEQFLTRVYTEWQSSPVASRPQPGPRP